MGELTRPRGIIFHVDAAQSAGKVEIDLQKMKAKLRQGNNTTQL